MLESVTLSSLLLGNKPNGEHFSFFIIDDSPFMHKTLGAMIESFGGIVAGTANDGIDAMNQLKVMKNPVDIITLDINMPILNGIKLLPMLKAMLPSVKIVMVSAYSKTDAIKETVALGADFFILKPFKPEQVFKVFNFVCQKEIKTVVGQPKLRNFDESRIGVFGLVKSEERAKTLYTILDWLGCNIIGITTESGEILVKYIETNKRSLNVFLIDTNMPESDFEKLFSVAFRANPQVKIIVLTTGASPESIEAFEPLPSYARLTFAEDNFLFDVLTGMFCLH